MGRLIFFIVLGLIGFYAVWPAYTGYRIYQGLEQSNPAALEATIDFPSVRRSMKTATLSQINERIETVLEENLGPASKMIAKTIPQDNIEKIVDGALETVLTPVRVSEIYTSGGDFNGAIKEAVMAEIDKMGGLAAVLNLASKAAGDPAGDGQAGADANNTAEERPGGDTIAGFKIPGGLAGILKNKDVQRAIGGIASKIAIDPDKLANKIFPGLTKNRSGSQQAGGGKPSFGVGNVKELGFAGPFGLRLGVARRSDAERSDLVSEMEFKNYDWRITRLTPNLINR